MKLKYLAVPALAALSSCTWMGQQTDSAMQWADRNMPTFDGSHPGANPPANNSMSAMLPSQYNGYPYNAALPRAPLNAPGVSGVATPPLPGYQVAPAGITSYSSKGMTPAQTTSAGEGGNSRPNPAAYNNNTGYNNNYNSLHGTTPGGPTYMVTPSANNLPADRRAPTGQLPPSAIQPAPYGAQQPGANGDFPAEYKNAGKPGADTDNNGMIPPPPI